MIDTTDPWPTLEEWLLVHEETMEKEWRDHPTRYAAACHVAAELSKQLGDLKTDLKKVEGVSFIAFRSGTHALQPDGLKMTDEVAKRCVDSDPAVVTARKALVEVVSILRMAEGYVRAMEMKERSLKYLTLRHAETGTHDPEVKAALAYVDDVKHGDPLAGLFDE
jgi:acyl-CoA thioesterase